MRHPLRMTFLKEWVWEWRILPRFRSITQKIRLVQLQGPILLKHRYNCVVQARGWMVMQIAAE